MHISIKTTCHERIEGYLWHEGEKRIHNCMAFWLFVDMSHICAFSPPSVVHGPLLRVIRCSSSRTRHSMSIKMTSTSVARGSLELPERLASALSALVADVVDWDD